MEEGVEKATEGGKKESRSCSRATKRSTKRRGRRWAAVGRKNGKNEKMQMKLEGRKGGSTA